MRKAIISGVLLTLLAGGALAQTNTAPPPAPTGAMTPNATMAAPPPPPPGPGAMDADGAGAPPPPPPGDRRGPPPPPPSPAAHFRLVRGDTVLDVKCADNEPMKSCADIAQQMLDKLQAQPRN